MLFLPLGLFCLFAIIVAATLLSNRNATDLPSALIGKKLPVFTTDALLEGEPTVRSADWQGGITLLNVFASWCAPCRDEHPFLMQLAQRDDIRLVGLNYKDRPDQAKAFLDELGNPYDSIGVDPQGRIGIELGVYGVPETYLIDADGVVRYRHVGPLTPKFLQETLPQFLKSSASQ